MHVVFVCSYFNEHYFISFLDFQTCVSRHFIYFVVEYYFLILCWTYKVVYQNQFVMALPPSLTHPSILLFFATYCGEMPTFDYTTSQWFLWYFIFLTLIYPAIFIATLINPSPVSTLNSLLIPSIFGLILLIVSRIIGGKESFLCVNIAGGKAKSWFIFGLVILAYSNVQTALSWLFKMGSLVDLSVLAAQSPARMSFSVLMILITVQILFLGPFLGLVVIFGEEYERRGFLQPALMKIEKNKGHPPCRNHLGYLAYANYLDGIQLSRSPAAWIFPVHLLLYRIILHFGIRGVIN